METEVFLLEVDGIDSNEIKDLAIEIIKTVRERTGSKEARVARIRDEGRNELPFFSVYQIDNYYRFNSDSDNSNSNLKAGILIDNVE